MVFLLVFDQSGALRTAQNLPKPKKKDDLAQSGALRTAPNPPKTIKMNDLVQSGALRTAQNLPSCTDAHFTT